MKDRTVGCHYFRMPRHLWELMLTRMRQLGATRIYTPVPWALHEFEAGKIDLRGLTNPRRGLTGFVALCRALALELILDLTPGPIAEANLLNHGIPGWLLRQHPEVRAQDAAGNPTDQVTFEQPTFLKFATRWLTQVSETIGGQQAPNGPITGVQTAFDLPADYLDHSDHIAKVQWPVWLRKRYLSGGIEALNAAYTPAQPYTSFSNVSLADPLTSAPFLQDRAEFIGSIKTHAVQTYTQLLQNQGWAITAPIEPPPHGFQVPVEALDVGRSLQWAMTAPVRSDGTLTGHFWQIREPLKIPADPTMTGMLSYRLEIDGTLVEAPTDQPTPDSPTPAGLVDLTFSMTDPASPIEGDLGRYLASLLAGRRETLKRCTRLAEQLAQALQPTARPETPAGPFPLSEAQLSLEEASVALRRAAASIGALEETFATALNKPAELSEAPLLLSLDGAQFGSVRDACQATAAQLNSALAEAVPQPMTVIAYQANHQNLVSAAQEGVNSLSSQLQWLREQIALGTLPTAARTVHYYLETILQSLIYGGLREGGE